ncbi:MAG: class I SAM-dependent methyltransferase [Magnetococcus sp. DMHC-6]
MTVLPVMRRCMENGRLALYHEGISEPFYDQHWRRHANPEILAKAEEEGLGVLEDILCKWLPKEGIILDAGCGLGQYVLALRQRGYQACGVEFSAETVDWIVQHRPDIPIGQGDITALQVADGYYAAYFSQGVLQEFYAGPDKALAEAFRVLRPGGVVILTILHFNWLRRWKYRLGMYRRRLTDWHFYAFAYTPEEFSGWMTDKGFIVEEWMGLHPYKGFKDELPLWLRLLLRRPWLGPRLEWRLRRLFNQNKKMAQKVDHLFVIVGRKPLR